MATTVTYSFTNIVSEFVVNDTTANDQFQPDVVTLPDGSFFVSFDTDSASNATYQDVVFRQFSPSGVALDANDVVASAGGGTDDEEDSAIAVLSNGNVVIVSEDNDGAAEDDVEFHIFSATGGTVDTNNIVTSAEGQATDSQTNPEVAALVGGGFVVVYIDQFAGSATNTNAEFVVYNNDGSVRSAAFIAGGEVTSLSVFDATVAALSNGNFVVTWREDIGAGDLNVKAQIFNASGTSVSGEITISSETDDQSQPAVIGLPGGGFAIVIRDQFAGSTTNSELELRIYDDAGTQVSTTAVVNSGADLVSEPDIAVISDNYLLVSYTSNRNGNNDIFAQVFDFGGNEIGSEFNLEVTAGTQASSAISSIGSGVFVSVWQDSESAGPDASGYHVAGQMTELTRTTISDGAGDVLVGDDLRDAMLGKGGADKLMGKDNEDTLNGGGGNDTVSGGAGNDNLIGASGDDRLNGGASGDRLNGGMGDDNLTGAGGADKFLFDAALNPLTNIDRITDFSGNDLILLDNAVFTGIGAALDLAEIRIGASAADANDRIIYNAATGALFFDADGVGGAAQQRFATIDAGLALSNTDFLMV